jgi:hypothetical protein
MSLAKRQAFGIIKRAYAKLGRKPVTTPSTLRLIVPLTANRTSFTFPILEGDSNVQHTNQILLNRADAFTATQVGIFVGGISLGEGYEVTTDLPNELIIQNPVAIDGLGGLKAFTLFNNSLLNIAVNNVQYLQNFDVFAMNKQQAVSSGASANDITNGMYGDKDGFVDLVPTLQFSGTSKIDITLNSPGALTATANNGLYLEIIFRGFLSLGASNLNK